ncbi:MAG: DNA-binding domain-containing protein [Beijerinckiaceae bacterium]|nr:DNA-binding domain-containing protein [Beijerinckiaceae bacterium]
MEIWQSEFANALRNPELAVPQGVVSYNSDRPRERFAVYRNNVAVGLIGALENRFPAARKIVGEEFFRGAARLFAAKNPPRSPVMMFYGDEFPSFLANFEPAREVPYLAGVARIEAARTRAYHAADAAPLAREALAAAAQNALAGIRFTLHPSLEVVESSYPIVTIWAMNSGAMELAPVSDWRGEDALVIRSAFEVEVRRLALGARNFLQSLAKGNPLAVAAAAASAADASFDVAENIAALFSGLAIAMRSEGGEEVAAC